MGAPGACTAYRRVAWRGRHRRLSGGMKARTEKVAMVPAGSGIDGATGLDIAGVEEGRARVRRRRKQYVKTLELLHQSAFGSTAIDPPCPEVHHHDSHIVTPTGCRLDKRRSSDRVLTADPNWLLRHGTSLSLHVLRLRLLRQQCDDFYQTHLACPRRL